jgi:hypothetical protein
MKALQVTCVHKNLRAIRVTAVHGEGQESERIVIRQNDKETVFEADQFFALVKQLENTHSRTNVIKYGSWDF